LKDKPREDSYYKRLKHIKIRVLKCYWLESLKNLLLIIRKEVSQKLHRHLHLYFQLKRYPSVEIALKESIQIKIRTCRI